MVDYLDHIAVTVPNIEKALIWYKSNFEVKTEYSDDTWALLCFENIKLALVLPDQHPPHFAILRKNLKRFEPLTKHRDGTSSVYINDPWGNVIELMKNSD